ncbi:MAG: beta-glucosidase, partial [Clostridia bacterium]|nr:beta-glucosidase [Clostridia bacterium]
MEQTKLLELLRSMSLEEKIGQLCQVPGVFYDGSAAVTGENWGTLSEEEMRLSGSTLGIWGAGKLRSIQERYMERHPHHIPLLFMLDVIHGHRTVFPCPLGQGATMDPELVQECARVQAREASSDGIHVTFSPMADLCRDARWGRVMESTGEDPYLSGKMASAMVRGYQGEDLSDPERVASCVKHFAAYGAPEAGRDYMNVELSEHTLRDQYMGGYEAAVKAGCEMVMSSFNTLNGVPCTGSRRLLHDILRDEWGFQGLVISDWGSVGEMVNHGFREDLKGAAEAAMEAGVDIDMCSGSYAGHLKELVLEGTIPESEIDQVALRVLELKNRLGLFEDPFRGCSGTRTEEIMLKEDHRALARKAVAASQVLLKNDGDVLPLGAGTHRIAL